jgi:hypothetical protein
VLAHGHLRIMAEGWQGDEDKAGSQTCLTDRRHDPGAKVPRPAAAAPCWSEE